MCATRLPANSGYSLVAMLCGAVAMGTVGGIASVVAPSFAFAQSVPPKAAPTVSPLEERLNATVSALQDDPRFKGVSEQQRRERIEFVTGNVLFALVHEVGHMVISEMGLPVLGREEDAADAFATITGLKMGDAMSDRVLTESARGWFLSDMRNQKEKIKMAFYDEHGLDRQRAYNIVCLMVGSNPERYGALADKTKLPQERQGSCQGDFSNASWSWEKALASHIRTADDPRTQINVHYADATGRYEIFARGFRKMMVLETVADHLSDRFKWRGPIGIEMQTCKEPGAHWDLSIRKIIVCYELAADFAQLYRDYANTPVVATKQVSRKARR